MSEFIDLCLLPRTNFSKTVCIAHNAQSFDSQFLLKYLVEKTRRKPEVILNGTKIIVMKVGNVKFVDSLNFMNLPLSSLPEAFSLPEIEKGIFPHLFNTKENENYVGLAPPIQQYSPETMKPKDREKFLHWYFESCIGEIFNFQTEICPFEEACTIASTCMRLYRKMCLKPNTISIIPRRGYRLANTQSREALKWLV